MTMDGYDMLQCMYCRGQTGYHLINSLIIVVNNGMLVPPFAASREYWSSVVVLNVWINGDDN